MAEKQRKKSKKYIQKVKSFASCQSCGIEDSACLEFHHLKDKKFTIANAADKGIKTIKKEMRKCIVLCSNCHKKEHYAHGGKKTK